MDFEDIWFHGCGVVDKTLPSKTAEIHHHHGESKTFTEQLVHSHSPDLTELHLRSCACLVLYRFLTQACDEKKCHKVAG